MFRIFRPTDSEIERKVISASGQGMLKREYLDELSEIRAVGLPNGFVLDRLRTPIGMGKEGFERAIQTFRSWDQFNLGWVRVANPSASILLGQIVAVEVHSFGLWSLNLSQIVEVVQTEHRFGFIYKTTTTHVEAGEERFEVTFDEESGVVSYLTEAVSRPRDLMALLGYPITRWFQHKFARDSHARMQTAASGGK